MVQLCVMVLFGPVFQIDYIVRVTTGPPIEINVEFKGEKRSANEMLKLRIMDRLRGVPRHVFTDD